MSNLIFDPITKTYMDPSSPEGKLVQDKYYSQPETTPIEKPTPPSTVEAPIMEKVPGLVATATNNMDNTLKQAGVEASTMSPAEKASMWTAAKNIVKSNPKLSIVAALGTLATGAYLSSKKEDSSKSVDVPAIPTPLVTPEPQKIPDITATPTEDNKKDNNLPPPPTPAEAPKFPEFEEFQRKLKDNIKPPDPNDPAYKEQVLNAADYKIEGFDKAAEYLKDKVGEAYLAYKKEKDSIKQEKLYEGIINGISSIMAGWYGMKHGVDMGGTKFSTTDWAARYNSAKDDLDAATKVATTGADYMKESINAKNQNTKLAFETAVANNSIKKSLYQAAVEEARFKQGQVENEASLNNQGVAAKNSYNVSKFANTSENFNKKENRDNEKAIANLKIEEKKQEDLTKKKDKLEAVTTKVDNSIRDNKLKDLDGLDKLLDNYSKAKGAEKEGIAMVIEGKMSARKMDTSNIIDTGFWGGKSVNPKEAAKIIQARRDELQGTTVTAPIPSAPIPRSNLVEQPSPNGKVGIFDVSDPQNPVFIRYK